MRPDTADLQGASGGVCLCLLSVSRPQPTPKIALSGFFYVPVSSTAPTQFSEPLCVDNVNRLKMQGPMLT